MSIAQLIAGSDAGNKSPKDGAPESNPLGRESAAATARRLAADCIVLDCETTGFGRYARVWGLGTQDTKAPSPTIGPVWLLNPGLLAPPPGGSGSQYEWDPKAYEMAIAALGGNVDPVIALATQPVFDSAAGDIVGLLANREVVGWNCEDFDERMLRKELVRINFSVFSQRWQTVRWHDAMYLYLNWRRDCGRPALNDEGKTRHRITLQEACKAEGVPHEAAHTPTSGVVCCLELLRRMAG